MPGGAVRGRLQDGMRAVPTRHAPHRGGRHLRAVPARALPGAGGADVLPPVRPRHLRGEGRPAGVRRLPRAHPLAAGEQPRDRLRVRGGLLPPQRGQHRGRVRDVRGPAVRRRHPPGRAGPRALPPPGLHPRHLRHAREARAQAEAEAVAGARQGHLQRAGEPHAQAAAQALLGPREGDEHDAGRGRDAAPGDLLRRDGPHGQHGYGRRGPGGLQEAAVDPRRHHARRRAQVRRVRDRDSGRQLRARLRRLRLRRALLPGRAADARGRGLAQGGAQAAQLQGEGGQRHRAAHLPRPEGAHGHALRQGGHLPEARPRPHQDHRVPRGGVPGDAAGVGRRQRRAGAAHGRHVRAAQPPQLHVPHAGVPRGLQAGVEGRLQGPAPLPAAPGLRQAPAVADVRPAHAEGHREPRHQPRVGPGRVGVPAGEGGVRGAVRGAGGGEPERVGVRADAAHRDGRGAELPRPGARCAPQQHGGGGHRRAALHPDQRHSLRRGAAGGGRARPVGGRRLQEREVRRQGGAHRARRALLSSRARVPRRRVRRAHEQAPGR
mmetsp:Transcript_10238/g.35624  ORF Transcript_10238/g.35624 Transcript_10238/m.35624 type:complete len:548 (-) Transcript_10238:310-1953(-)